MRVQKKEKKKKRKGKRKREGVQGRGKEIVLQEKHLASPSTTPYDLAGVNHTSLSPSQQLHYKSGGHQRKNVDTVSVSDTLSAFLVWLCGFKMGSARQC